MSQEAPEATLPGAVFNYTHGTLRIELEPEDSSFLPEETQKEILRETNATCRAFLEYVLNGLAICGTPCHEPVNRELAPYVISLNSYVVAVKTSLTMRRFTFSEEDLLPLIGESVYANLTHLLFRRESLNDQNCTPLAQDRAFAPSVAFVSIAGSVNKFDEVVNTQQARSQTQPRIIDG